MRRQALILFALRFSLSSTAIIMQHSAAHPPAHKISTVKRRSRPSRRRPHPSEDDDVTFSEVVNRRVSVRSFTEDPVSDRALRDALRTASLAPSAGNLQAYQVVIVRDNDQKAAVGRAAVGQTWIADAPVVLVFLAHPERSGFKYGNRGRYLYAVQDATIAAAYTQLALQAAGLASCWVGAFQEDLVAAAVGAPYGDEVQGSLRPVAVMPVGVAAERDVRHPWSRRAVEDFVHDGQYGASVGSNSDCFAN